MNSSAIQVPQVPQTASLRALLGRVERGELSPALAIRAIELAVKQELGEKPLPKLGFFANRRADDLIDARLAPTEGGTWTFQGGRWAFVGNRQ